MGQTAQPQVGQKYRHYKTNAVYFIMAIATMTETSEEVVVYYGKDNQIWVRPMGGEGGWTTPVIRAHQSIDGPHLKNTPRFALQNS